MKLNQFLKSDVEVAKRKSDSVESMADLLLASLKDGDYEEALDILGSIKANIEDLKRISNKGLLYDTALKMKQRGIDLSVVRRSLG
ncbi:YqaH family protein [Bacillus subtilis]|uniref:YqaH family protein n=1 Tax=Bacillus subtilis TaxID=1423 RepID=UPI00240E5C68|nr:YqaH family protein [Bacillus subtilis]WEY89737.1 YqaH family protein [Bacillus subtilis]WEZ21286.1 YqaH family protein [Bacillus subtilis]